MILKSICLGPDRSDVRGASVLLRTAAAALTACSPGLVGVQRLRVLRHVTSDSVKDPQAQGSVVPQAARIASALEFHFDSQQSLQDCTGGPAWASFAEQVLSVAPIILSLDAHCNVPIIPTDSAATAGFRRWMLLARKAATQEQFRDAWFGRHADLVKRLPHVDGYLQNLVTQRYDAQGRKVGYEQLPVDGIAEMCFADEAVMNASYASEARLPLRDDGRELLGRIDTMLVQAESLS